MNSWEFANSKILKHGMLPDINEDTDNVHVNSTVNTITDVSNVYTLDLKSSNNISFEITTGNTTAKTIAFDNIPSGFVQFACKVDFDNVADITYPTSVVWQDDLEPVMEEDMIYWLLFVTSDGGTTVYGSYLGGW